jgi:3-deoxy-7-phosphoheptulonate synthase
VGRFAGQYAKPRSSDLEVRDGVSLPSYRGEIINGAEFTAEERKPDPERMVRGYQHAALTLNFIRALVEGGFADLHHPEYWDLGFVTHSPRAREYQRMVTEIADSVRFLETLAGVQAGDLNRVDFYTSHEGLLLQYEQSVTRQVPRRPGWYNLGTHFPWIGLRTADVEGAHVDYFRGIRNPLGIKIGPGMTPEDLLELLEALDPDLEPGRVTLIHRMGHEIVAERLPALVEAVLGAGRTVLWCCDPMHGNTETTTTGRKTRRFDNILSELEQSFEIHAGLDSYLGGVHFELSGDNVTECVGGARGLTEVDLDRAYESRVDPRLNYEQALEMALLIARKIASMNGRSGGDL